MEKVIRNMNFKPMLEKFEYKKLPAPEKNSTVNMRVWDELKVERLRSDAVKVILERYVDPEPASLFSLSCSMSIEVLVNQTAYDGLDDPEDYFKNTNVSRVLASNIATIIADITMHSPIGPMISAPVLQLPQ